jgi:hypothetical protein
VQTLDYVNVPFKCVIFHRFGHVMVHFGAPNLNKKWVLKSMKESISHFEDLQVT